MSRKAPLFYASRTDGFGERLRAILNAQVAAAHFGGRFGFHWGEMDANKRDYNCVGPVSATFAPDFIATYHMDAGQLAGMRSMDLSEVKKELARTGAFPPEAEAIKVVQGSLVYQGVVFPAGTDQSALLRAAWNDLPFAPTLEAARQLAKAVPFPARAAGIHLRAGDIVYGRHRTTDHFHHKVCAYPLVEEVIRNQIRAGFTPVLFGQDLALCRYLRDRHGILLADDMCLGTSFDDNQQAMFEIVLMSRCSRIFAEVSGFAILATTIGGVARSSPLSGFSPQQKVRLIEAAIFDEDANEDVSQLQRAFACRNAFVLSGVHFPTEPRFQKLLDHAREMDPENDLYLFVQAVASYASGDAKTGEDILRTILRGENHFLSVLFSRQPWTARYEVDPYLPVLTQQAELGFAMAALFVSRAYDFRGDKAKAGHFSALIQTATSADPAQ